MTVRFNFKNGYSVTLVDLSPEERAAVAKDPRAYLMKMALEAALRGEWEMLEALQGRERR